LFQLPYRHTEGLGKSLVQLMKIELAIPDYTSLAKRAAKLNVSLDIAKHRGRIDVVVDSTGLKVFRRRRMEDAQTRQEQTPHVAEIASGSEPGHP
jgi:hypothetical protein